MIKKNILRLLITLLVGIIVSSLGSWGSISDDIPKVLFEVLSVLFPLALAVVTSIDLLRIKNTRYRKDFRISFRNVRNSIITQFTFSVLAIVVVYLYEVEGCLRIWVISIWPNFIATCVIAFSIAHVIYNFVQIQQLKEDIEDRLEEESL